MNGERPKQGTPLGVRSGPNGSVPDPLEPAPADNGADNGARAFEHRTEAPHAPSQPVAIPSLHTLARVAHYFGRVTRVTPVQPLHQVRPQPRRRCKVPPLPPPDHPTTPSPHPTHSPTLPAAGVPGPGPFGQRRVKGELYLLTMSNAYSLLLTMALRRGVAVIGAGSGFTYIGV